eukprot:g30079.t1
MDSACGLIPDSGTTLITGPKHDIEKLYEGICQKWPRCKEMHKALQTQLETGRSGRLFWPEEIGSRKATKAPRALIVGHMRSMLQAGSTQPIPGDVDDYYDYDDVEDYDDDYGEPLEGSYYSGPGPDYMSAGPDGSYMEPDYAEEEPYLESPEGPEGPEGPGGPEGAEGPEGPEGPEDEGPEDEEPDVVVTIPDAGGVPDDQIIPSDAVPDEAENPVTGPEYGPEEEPEMPEAISMASTHCYTWLGNGTDLDTEMPNLAFEVQGTAGGQESLKLDPNSYVFLTTVPIVHKEVEYFLGYLPVEIVTVRQQQVCIPAFSPMNYRTKQNGSWAAVPHELY